MEMRLTSNTIVQENRGSNPLPIFLLIIVALGIVFSIGLNITHATNENHPSIQSAVDARNCFNKSNIVKISLFDKINKNYVRYCFDTSTGNIAVRVLKKIGEKTEEITAYMKTEGSSSVYKIYTLKEFWKFIETKLNKNMAIAVMAKEDLNYLQYDPELIYIYDSIMRTLAGGY